MATRLKNQKVIKLRYEYFLYVYKKYIYNVFTELNRPKNEQIILGMIEHNTKPEILENYIENVTLPESHKEMLLSWKSEIFGNMHIICFDKDKVFLYCKETDEVYHVHLLDVRAKYSLKMIPFTMSMHATIFPIYNTYYFDSVVNIHSKYDDSLASSEKLYEHIYTLLVRDKKELSQCFIYSTRSLKTDKFSNIFLDYMGPMCPLVMELNELEVAVKLACLAWNNELMEDINIGAIANDAAVLFLQERKRKYFSQIDRVIVDYEIVYDDEGFELITYSNPIESLKTK